MTFLPSFAKASFADLAEQSKSAKPFSGHQTKNKSEVWTCAVSGYKWCGHLQDGPAQLQIRREGSGSYEAELAWMAKVPDSLWNNYQSKTGVERKDFEGRSVFDIEMGICERLQLDETETLQCTVVMQCFSFFRMCDPVPRKILQYSIL